MWALSFLLACVDPFARGRHDLVENRIVGAREHEGALEAFVWEGESSFSEVAPTRTWSGEGLACVEAECTVGPTFAAKLSVEGTDWTETANYTRSEAATAPSMGTFERAIDGHFATISVEVPESHRVHWSTPEGELVETGAGVVEYTVNNDGIYPVVALFFDGEGGNDWRVIDLAFGEVGPTLSVGSRLLPFAVGLESPPDGEQSWTATIAESEDRSGILLDELTVGDTGFDEGICGTNDSTGIWDPDRLIDRTCGRTEVLGATVLLYGTVNP